MQKIRQREQAKYRPGLTAQEQSVVFSRTWMPILDWRDFPASWEKTGNFIGSGLRDPHIASKKPSRSITHNQIPYAPEQGIDWAVAGNLVRSSR